MAAPALVLYSFRRCPYAIRARLALRAAGLVPGVDLELREVHLAGKPPELLDASPAGTVPALMGPDGVLQHSLEIINWALDRHDPQGWRAGWDRSAQTRMAALIEQNDGPFKHHLDRCRYPQRFGLDAARARVHRDQALAILEQWNSSLGSDPWLLGARPAMADWALLPFVRQLWLSDPAPFTSTPSLSAVAAWLARFLQGPELAAVMAPPWGERHPWRSPRWLYHLTLEPEWRQAQQEGVYRRSTRGLDLDRVGFIHASYHHQIANTHAHFYADADNVLLLTIDPEQLAATGVDVRAEAPPECEELFPHLYGPLPLSAVLRAEPWHR
ncbi:MAG: DUF952 domain-containing protein [Cyanobacteriota bacterium]|nr:DUF952 domain-containing protein [Cyanobacteriota bacterium]